MVTHKQYKYRLKINVQDYDFTGAVASATITNGSTLTGFSASRGNYTQSVKLTWEDLRKVPAGVYFQRVVFTNGETIVRKLTK